MMSAIRNFFEQHIAPPAGEPAAGAGQRARVAAAALLVEVLRRDDRLTGAERDAVLASVQRKFGIEPAAARQLLDLAEAEAREAHDYYQFTSQVNAAFTPGQKRRLIEELWMVAYADDVLHRHEEHLIRRVAELLHLPHREFIRSKLRAQAARSAPVRQGA